jgi:hypothetical protein
MEFCEWILLQHTAVDSVDKDIWRDEVCFVCEGVSTVNNSQTRTWKNPHAVLVVDININCSVLGGIVGDLFLGIHLLPEGQFLQGFLTLWKLFCWDSLDICLEL